MSTLSFTYSGNVYDAASAGQQDFPLTTSAGLDIPYLQRSHIHVSISDDDGDTWVELARPAEWDFVNNGTTCRLVTGISAGDWVLVKRITPGDVPYVTFQPSSLLTAEQLNDFTLFNTYVTQEQIDLSLAAEAQASATANTALSTANTADSNASTALSTANTADSNASTALSTANSAASDAATALSTANTADSNASTALSTANTADSNASTALSTANTAASDASNAVSTANTALSTANSADSDATQALSTANSAASDASTALSTANSAASDAATALSTANTADSNASTALSTANTAASDASSALTTANDADSKADQAIASVSSAVLFDLIADVSEIPASPDDGDSIEVGDSTGIESFTPLAGLPGGFIGDSGLTVRLRYTSANSSWNWLSYFANNSETRYLKKTSVASQAEAEAGTENTKYLTSLRVAQAIAVADTVPSAREVSSGTGLTGGGDLSADITISADVASQAEAEAGTDASKLMTPLRVAEAIAALSQSGATGAGDDRVFVENDQIVSTSYAIPVGKNASSVGPVSIDAGVTVTISSTSTWVIL